MKKVLLTLIAVLMAVPAFAIEVYNNGENAVDIYGTLRGYIGYGHGVDGVSDTTDDNFLYGIQGNSRIGVRLKVGNFSGQVELGAVEATLYGRRNKKEIIMDVELGAVEATLYGRSTGSNVGLRQAWGAYSFGNAGALLAGKTDTPTAMGGFISDIMDTDGGLNGFGGSTTGSRRFQIQYNVAGLSIALIENDMAYGPGVSYGYTDGGETKTPTKKNGDGGVSYGYTDGGETIPRLGLSYTYKNPSLLVKVAATYSALNGTINAPVSDTRWATVHAFGVALGLKPTFMDGKMWLSVLARYGMNEELYGEAKTVYNGGLMAHSSIDNYVGVQADGTVDNVQRAAVALELGYNVNDMIAVIVGGGYQHSMIDALTYDVGSYAVFLQAPIKISGNFALIPQFTYTGTRLDSDNKDSLVLAMQARITF